MFLGIANHYGWAVAVTASADHHVVDRRKIALIEDGLPAAPIHHEGGPHSLHRRREPLDDEALAELAARVRASVARATAAGLDSLTATITSISLRSWPQDFPEDITMLRRAPYESRADSVMYRRVLAELAEARGWAIHLYDAASIEAQAARILGDRAHEVLHGPKLTLSAPWAKDHRMALAATIVASVTAGKNATRGRTKARASESVEAAETRSGSAR